MKKVFPIVVLFIFVLMETINCLNEAAMPLLN